MRSFIKQSMSGVAISLLALLIPGCGEHVDNTALSDASLDSVDYMHPVDPPTNFDLDSWAREIDVGGRKLAYWDGDACMRRNFPQLFGEDNLDAIKQASQQMMAKLGRKMNDDQLVQGLIYPAYVAKLMCSRKWNWLAIDTDGKLIDKVNPYKLLITAEVARSIEVEQQTAVETGQQKMLQMKSLIDGIVALRMTRMCAEDVKIDGCEMAAKVAGKPGWETGVAFARSFNTNKDYGASAVTPQRLLLANEPEVAIFTDYNGKLTTNTIAAAPIAMGKLSPLDQALLGQLAQIDGQTLPLTANAEADHARGIIAVVFQALLRQRERMKSADPKAFTDLRPLSVVFIAKASPPSCGGLIADRSGFYCPATGVVYIAANDPLKQQRVPDADLYGPALAVIVHELAHFALHRAVSDYSPFVDEGLATAIGERALTGIIAGLAYGRANKQAASAMAELAPGNVSTDPGLAEREIAKVLTPTQTRLICAARRAPVTPDEIELGLKLDAARFQANAERNYAVAWLVAEVMLGNAGNAASQPTKLAKLFDLEQQFNTGMRPATATTLKTDLQAIAAAANSRLASYPVHCGGTR